MERTGNQSGCHPSCGLEFWPSHLHITLAQRALGSKHKVKSLATGSADTRCEAGKAPLLPRASVYKMGITAPFSQSDSENQTNYGWEMLFKLWNTYINVGISHSYNANRGIHIKSRSGHKSSMRLCKLRCSGTVVKDKDWIFRSHLCHLLVV